MNSIVKKLNKIESDWWMLMAIMMLIILLLSIISYGDSSLPTYEKTERVEGTFNGYETLSHNASARCIKVDLKDGRSYYMTEYIYQEFKRSQKLLDTAKKGDKVIIQAFDHNAAYYKPRICALKSKRQILMRSDTKLPQPFASWSNSL